jgi:hypothetical protein
MAGDLLLKNAVDASAVAFWRKHDTRGGAPAGPSGSGRWHPLFANLPLGQTLRGYADSELEAG